MAVASRLRSLQAERPGGERADGGANVSPDVEAWLQLVEEFHGAARATAEGQVELSDARAQGAAVSHSIGVVRRAGEALRRELADLQASKRHEAAQAGRRLTIMEEELSLVLEEQAKLRHVLRRSGESAQADWAAAARARQECGELERRIGDSRNICMDLADDRGLQIRELEANCKQRRDGVARLEEALEQERAVAQMQQAELWRRQRHNGFEPVQTPLPSAPSWGCWRDPVDAGTTPALHRLGPAAATPASSGLAAGARLARGPGPLEDPSSIAPSPVRSVGGGGAEEAAGVALEPGTGLRASDLFDRSDLASGLGLVDASGAEASAGAAISSYGGHVQLPVRERIANIEGGRFASRSDSDTA